MSDHIQSLLGQFNLSAHSAWLDKQNNQSGGGAASTDHPIEVAAYKVEAIWTSTPTVTLGAIVYRYTTYESASASSQILSVEWKLENQTSIANPPSYANVRRLSLADATSDNQLVEIGYLRSIDTRLSVDRDITTKEYTVVTSWSDSPVAGQSVYRIAKWDLATSPAAVIGTYWFDGTRLISAPPSDANVSDPLNVAASARNTTNTTLATIDADIKKNGRSLLVTNYTVALPWTASQAAGNVVRQVALIDTTINPPTLLGTQWVDANFVSIPIPPSTSNYSEIGVGIGSAATALNQLTEIGYLSEIKQNTASAVVKLTELANIIGRYDGFKVQETDSSVAGTTYVRKAGSDASAWLILKRVVTATATVITYAGIRNNPGVLTATAAWAARGTLIYGDLGQA